MSKKLLLRLFLLCLVLGALLAVIGLLQFKGNAVVHEGEFFVSKNDSYEQVVASLKERIKRHTAFDYYAQHINLKTSFKAGRYLIHPHMNVIQIARMLGQGLQSPIRLKFQYAKIPSQLAAKIAPQIDADSVEVLRALTSPKLAEELGFTPKELFSVCIPNTYEVYWTISGEDFVRRMHKEYERFWKGNRDTKRQKMGMSRMQVMTLASIVAEETRAQDEMSRIAGVYMNRLRKGIPLQADPTVKYALQDFGLRRILYKHLKYESPYNTYLNRGLPPTPICLPSIAAIDATLNYEHHSYLYFCARPTFDGRHNFATTLRQHNANARAWAQALNHRKIK